MIKCVVLTFNISHEIFKNKSQTARNLMNSGIYSGCNHTLNLPANIKMCIQLFLSQLCF